MARREGLDQQGVIEAFEQVVRDVDARWVAGAGRVAHANHVAFSPDGSRVALSTWNAGEMWRLDDLLATLLPADAPAGPP